MHAAIVYHEDHGHYRCQTEQQGNLSAESQYYLKLRFSCQSCF